MRISKKQAADNKARVVAGARELFGAHGFEKVGVADAMRAAGMTHGGFYNHFPSKDALAAEVCRAALASSVAKVEAIAAIADEKERKAAMAEYMGRYVSAKTRDAPSPSCPMAAFAGEMPRQAAPVATAYAEGLSAYLDAFTAAGGQDWSRQEALARFAALAGALILARSVAATDPQLSDELLASAKVELAAAKIR
jgi:TetR/AcrR family transcriptional regulator, transcriptional repressor for nem operon